MNPEIEQLQHLNNLITATLTHFRGRTGFTHTPYYGNMPYYGNTPWNYTNMGPWTQGHNWNPTHWDPGFQHTPYTTPHYGYGYGYNTPYNWMPMNTNYGYPTNMPNYNFWGNRY